MAASAPEWFRRGLRRSLALGCLGVGLGGACSGQGAQSDPPDDGVEPVFPKDVAEWPEGRECMFSHEHDLRYIRVVTDEAARIPYQALDEQHPYPAGATLVKLEYEDEKCRKLQGYTAMQKLPNGGTEAGSDWRWQRVDAERNVTEDGLLERCVDCHQYHCTWPICGYERCGFDLTCGREP